MTMEKKRLKKIIIILTILLVINMLALAGVLIVGAKNNESSASISPDNYITPISQTVSKSSHVSQNLNLLNVGAPILLKQNVSASTEDVSLALYKSNPEERVPFYVVNMFPGDQEKAVYKLDVSYQGTIIVRFRTEILPGYEKLAEVLKCKVQLGENKAPLYDGLMKDMPASVDTEISSEVGTTETLDYIITVYLDTSVGNEYQYTQLFCDFYWWVESEETETSATTEPSSEETTPPATEPDCTHPEKPTKPDCDPGRPEKPTKPTCDPPCPGSPSHPTTCKPKPPGGLIDHPNTGTSTHIKTIAGVTVVASLVFAVMLIDRKVTAYE